MSLIKKMKTNKLSFCLVLVLLLLGGPTALAKIDRDTVEAAWDRVTEADDFERVPIEYEEEGGPNAWVSFETDGKYSVHVTQEMMDALDSEEEIAGILGHEIGHVRLGHYNQDVLSSIGQTLLETHKDRMSGLAGAIGSVGVELTKSQFSREQETEADEYGVELLVEAGYSPWALHRAMMHFAAEDQQTKGFDTHPGTGPRLKYLAELARAEESGD
nr:M48 family metallopeptidase [Fretibacterium sp.]